MLLQILKATSSWLGVLSNMDKGDALPPSEDRQLSVSSTCDDETIIPSRGYIPAYAVETGFVLQYAY